MRKTFFFALLFLINANLFAVVDSTAQSKTSKNIHHDHVECSNILDIFTSGEVGGRVRYYFMNTNHLLQKDYYYANALGGALSYHTANFHGFSAGLVGIYVYNVGSSALHDSMLTSNELQLFDITNASNRKNLDRLEELFISYQWKNNLIKFGKQDITTPLVNPQDSRMKPSVVKGIWTELEVFNFLQLKGGWFTKASPRSTVEWYPISEAIGIYGNGVNIEGTSNYYVNQTHSKGLGIANIEFDRAKHNHQFWLHHINNVLNIYMWQSEWNQPIKNAELVLGSQFLYEQPHLSGGSVNEKNAYYHPEHEAYLASGRIGLKKNNNFLTLNATHIFDNGRFVFPREFGREQFYTTIPRGRIEGLGNTTQMLVKFEKEKVNNLNLSGYLAYGRTLTPSINNYQLNKYQTRSFDQFALFLNYAPGGFFHGLNFELLYTALFSTHLHDNIDYRNDINMHQINLIANIQF